MQFNDRTALSSPQLPTEEITSSDGGLMSSVTNMTVSAKHDSIAKTVDSVFDGVESINKTKCMELAI